MRRKVVCKNDPGWLISGCKFVGGLDITERPDGHLVAVLAVLSFPELCFLFNLSSVAAEEMSYVPGVLGAREAPHFIRLMTDLFKTHPEITRDKIVFIVDGNGVLHERGFGSACHVGVVADVMCIGAAKNYHPCSGVPAIAPIESLVRPGDWVQLGSIPAAVVKSSGSKPIYVSVGHRMSLESSVDFLMRCCPRYRIPEPIRSADHLSRELAKHATTDLG
jgi:deoxyinosine 3'endonuclease (endonuclease V)